MSRLQSLPPINTPSPTKLAAAAGPAPAAPAAQAPTRGLKRVRRESVCQQQPGEREWVKRLREAKTLEPTHPQPLAPSPVAARVLLLHQRDLRVGYRYVAGQAAGIRAPVAQRAGALIVGEARDLGKLQLFDVVDAVLRAMLADDPNAPPAQRARFQSLALRFDVPGVPYWLRAIFIDVGECPTVPNATSRTVVLAASRHRITCEVEGTAPPTLLEALAALRHKLATEAQPAETPVSHRIWQRPNE